MRAVAFVPARGGSKRVPGKNLREVGGVSLLARAAHAAEACERVVVSSDSADVLDAVADYNDQVPRVEWHERHPQLATDHAQIEDAIAHWWTRLNDKPDVLVLLQPTSPFRTAQHVREALALLERTGADSVVGVTVGHEHHFAGRLKPREATLMHVNREVRSGELVTTADGPIERVEFFDWVPFAPENESGSRPRTQDLPPRGHSNGSLYVTTRAAWERTRLRASGHVVALPMTRWAGLDVDDEDDLRVANALVAGGVCE